MEKITIYFNNGKFEEFPGNSIAVVSGNHLTVTTKSTVEAEDNQHMLVTTTKIFDLREIKTFVKINNTVKFDHKYVSEK
jgi:hypothetical protein